MEFKLLDIAIGLFFVYLLLSIFAMAIMEVISALFRMRGELLKDTLNKMLFDAKQEKQETNNASIEKFYDRPIMNFLGDNMTSWLFLDKLVRKIPWWKQNQKLPSYIKPEDFMDALLMYINEDQYTKDLEKITARIDENIFLSEKTKKHLLYLIQKSDGKIQNFKYHLIHWFKETMDRANSWYSRQVQYILIVVGLVISVVINADTISIFKKLNHDPKLRTELVDSAAKYVNDNKNLPENNSKDFQDLEKNVENQYQNLIKESGGILSWEKEELDDLKSNWWLKLFGFIMTAAAISLGSNFWFDMLKKVINVRVLGQPKTTQK